MATGSTYRLSFHIKLFVYLISLMGLFMLCFVCFQYQREKTFNAELLYSNLQHLNTRFNSSIKKGNSVEYFIKNLNPTTFSNLKLSIIDTSEISVYDAHSDNPEITAALEKGTGYAIRHSVESSKDNTFYCTSLIDGRIILSAVSYNLSINEILRADYPFFKFIGVFTLFFFLIVFLLTSKLGLTISHLREFATMAEKREPINSSFRKFPNDELGDISRKIVDLYDELRKTQSALTKEHLKTALYELEQSHIKKQLTQNISHELKTPVSSIQGYLETIINNPSISEKKKDEFINKSLAQTSRLSQLLQDISIITRMDEASEIIEKELLCLSDSIVEIFQDQEDKIKEGGFSINIQVPEGLYITGNLFLLHSIFSNLLENALSYSTGDKIELRLLRKTHSQYFFSFYDNGVGIDEKHFSRIFERFYRIDKGRSRKLGGTGLGLSIVKNAVVLHDGTITAQQKEGGGLEFLFSLKKKP